MFQNQQTVFIDYKVNQIETSSTPRRRLRSPGKLVPQTAE